MSEGKVVARMEQAVFNKHTDKQVLISLHIDDVIREGAEWGLGPEDLQKRQRSVVITTVYGDWEDVPDV